MDTPKSAMKSNELTIKQNNCRNSMSQMNEPVRINECNCRWSVAFTNDNGTNYIIYFGALLMESGHNRNEKRENSGLNRAKWNKWRESEWKEDALVLQKHWTNTVSHENDCMLETQEGKLSYWSAMRAPQLIIWSLELRCHKSIVISALF